MSLILDESDSSISLENAYPITTEEGLSQEGYKFRVKNNETIPSQYIIYLDNDTIDSKETRINPKYAS